MGTGSLAFNDHVTADGISKMNSVVYKSFLSAQVRANASKLVGWRIILQQDNDPKHTAKATNEFSEGKNWNILYG